MVICNIRNVCVRPVEACCGDVVTCQGSDKMLDFLNKILRLMTASVTFLSKGACNIIDKAPTSTLINTRL